MANKPVKIGFPSTILAGLLIILGLVTIPFTAVATEVDVLIENRVLTAGRLDTSVQNILPGLLITTTSSGAGSSGESADNRLSWRLNWNLDDYQMMYFSVSSDSLGNDYNLVLYSNPLTYIQEELISYELGYRNQFFNNNLQLKSAVYYHDYSNIQTLGLEINLPGVTASSLLEAQGAQTPGVEVEILWLATDRITVGGQYNHVPEVNDESLLIRYGTDIRLPQTRLPQTNGNLNITGNQIQIVPENKSAAWASYVLPLGEKGGLEFQASATWIDEVYFSQFESDFDQSPEYRQYDLRTTWTSPNENWVVSGFVKNVLDESGVGQNEGDNEVMRKGQTTEPRLYGVDATFSF